MAQPQDEQGYLERADRTLRAYCRTRSTQLRNEVVTDHLYIAKIVARRFAGKGVEFEDLYQVACLALIKALDRFDCSKGVRFSTFATPNMMGEVKNYFRDKARLIRLPRSVAEISGRLSRAREELTADLARSPTAKELAERLAVSQEEVLEALEALSAGRVSSLQQQVGEESDAQLAQFLGAEDEALARADDKAYIGKIWDELSAVERQVLDARYRQQKSQREVAEALNVSQMYVSRLERRVLQRLRESANDPEG